MPTMSARREFLQQLGLNAAGLLILPGISGHPAPGHPTPGSGSASLPRSTPEQQGVTSASVRTFLAAIKASDQEFHSIMIIRHGHVIAEGWWSPFSAGQHQQLYSLSKSFTGTAIGLAVDERRLSINDPVISFFPKDLPSSISNNLAALKVRHLLSMSVGQDKDSILTLEATPPGTTWEETFLALPVVYDPGARFLYKPGRHGPKMPKASICEPPICASGPKTSPNWDNYIYNREDGTTANSSAGNG
jgi:hypothetical protein